MAEDNPRHKEVAFLDEKRISFLFLPVLFDQSNYLFFVQFFLHTFDRFKIRKLRSIDLTFFKSQFKLLQLSSQTNSKPTPNKFQANPFNHLH